MMFMMSPEKHAEFVDEKNRVAQLFAAYTGVADFLMRWGPLVSDSDDGDVVQPDHKGKDNYVMRQAANQKALLFMLRRRALKLPLEWRPSSVAMLRLSDELAVGVGMKPRNPGSSAGVQL